MYHYYCLNPISAAGLSRFTMNYAPTEKMEEADMILVRSASMHGMELSKNVVAIARAGAGVNNLPLAQLAEQGVVVFNTPGANANGVKEMVFAGMLLAAREVVEGINWAREQKGNPDISKDAEVIKKKFAGHELSGRRLGVIGLGAIGQLVANAAVHMGMDVYGYDPYISVDAAWNLSRSIKHISHLQEIYRECDYITLHVPLVESTRGMISREAINMMKSTAVLLNFARDLLVDEEAVIEALSEGRLHRYVSDFPNPLVAGQEGVILSPHLGASTAESEDNCARMAVSELEDFIENGNIRNSVNYPGCSMGVCTSTSRIGICHLNTRKMISQFTNILADINIANMSNSSKGEYAYTLFDIEDRLSDEKLRQLENIEGVARVRVIR